MSNIGTLQGQIKKESDLQRVIFICNNKEISANQLGNIGILIARQLRLNTDTNLLQINNDELTIAVERVLVAHKNIPKKLSDKMRLAGIPDEVVNQIRPDLFEWFSVEDLVGIFLYEPNSPVQNIIVKHDSSQNSDRSFFCRYFQKKGMAQFGEAGARNVFAAIQSNNADQLAGLLLAGHGPTLETLKNLPSSLRQKTVDSLQGLLKRTNDEISFREPFSEQPCEPPLVMDW